MSLFAIFTEARSLWLFENREIKQDIAGRTYMTPAKWIRKEPYTAAKRHGCKDVHRILT